MDISIRSFLIQPCFTLKSHELTKKRGSVIYLESYIEAETFSGKKFSRVYFGSFAASKQPNILQKVIRVDSHDINKEICYNETVYVKVRYTRLSFSSEGFTKLRCCHFKIGQVGHLESDRFQAVVQSAAAATEGSGQQWNSSQYQQLSDPRPVGSFKDIFCKSWHL